MTDFAGLLIVATIPLGFIALLLVWHFLDRRDMRRESQAMSKFYGERMQSYIEQSERDS